MVESACDYHLSLQELCCVGTGVLSHFASPGYCFFFLLFASQRITLVDVPWFPAVRADSLSRLSVATPEIPENASTAGEMSVAFPRVASFLDLRSMTNSMSSSPGA